MKVHIKSHFKNAISGSSGFKGSLNVVGYEKGLGVFQKNLEITDYVVFYVDFKKDLKLLQLTEPKTFDLLVTYTDDATKKSFKATKSFSVEVGEHSINIVHSPTVFKAGIPYSFTVLVTKVDGYPVLNSKRPVEITVTDNNDTLIIHGGYKLEPTTGSVEVVAPDIPLTAEFIIVKAKYDRIVYSIKIKKATTYQKELVSFNVLTPR